MPEVRRLQQPRAERAYQLWQRASVDALTAKAAPTPAEIDDLIDRICAEP
jgi:hypothetical protein